LIRISTSVEVITAILVEKQALWSEPLEKRFVCCAKFALKVVYTAGSNMYMHMIVHIHMPANKSHEALAYSFYSAIKGIHPRMNR